MWPEFHTSGLRAGITTIFTARLMYLWAIKRTDVNNCCVVLKLGRNMYENLTSTFNLYTVCTPNGGELG
jgi:hypothetical protein